jgi:formylglycine-generating enzyme required for sulfatase activity
VYPVTTAQFRAYWEATGADLGEPVHLAGDANAPVANISWWEAKSFCAWLTKLAAGKGWLARGRTVTLPSEAEWEKAARGGLALLEAPIQVGWVKLAVDGPPASRENPSAGRKYPWGAEFEANRSNSVEARLVRPNAVGCFPGGVGPFGAEELSGNVWEWTRSLFEGYPYLKVSRREPARASNDSKLAVRGGAFNYDVWYVRCASRVWCHPDYRFVNVGFRVVLSPAGGAA